MIAFTFATGQALYNDYMEVIRAGYNDNDAIKQWGRFAQLYSPYIKKFPEWSHNMAINQSPSSFVAKDVTKLQPEKKGWYR